MRGAPEYSGPAVLKWEILSPSSHKNPGQKFGKLHDGLPSSRRGRPDGEIEARLKREFVSISGARDELSRSRRTVAKALADVPADAVRSGLKLWKTSKIIAAIDANTRAPITVKPVRQGDQVLTGVAAQCAMAFQEYHDAEDAMTKLPTVDERRAFAREELWPMGMEALALMKERDTACHLHEEHVQLRHDAVWRLMLRGVEIACEWTSLQAMEVLDPDPDEAAA